MPEIDKKQNKTSAFYEAIQQGLFEVLGEKDVELCHTGEPAFTDQSLEKYLSEKYPAAEAFGLAISIGKCAYLPLSKSFIKELDFQNPDFRLLPSGKKINCALERIAEQVFRLLPQQISRTSDINEETFSFSGSSEQAQLCAYLLDGILQAMLCDISGGHFYPIEVISEKNHCEIKIQKKGSQTTI